MFMNRLSLHDRRGFTLVEVMVALVVAFLVIGAVYASNKVQQQNERIQQQVTQIQQNLRAGMDMISREFRMAGYDPFYTGEYGVTNAIQNQFHFTADMCEDEGAPANCAVTEPPEIYEYSLFTPPDADANDTFSLRNVNGGTAVAENIERIEFRYVLSNGTRSFAPPVGQYDNLTAVEVSMLGRADEPDYNYTDNNTYTTLGGTIWDPKTFPAADCPNANCLNFRRRLLVKTVDLRNMGLF